MDYKEVICTRHSVRKYESRPIDRELLDDCVSDALLAPSSKNSKSSGFMIIEEPGLLEEISKMRDHGSSFLKGAAAAIIVLGDTTKTDLWLDNAAISATYIMLSAADKGLGSCWIHVNGRPRVKDDPSKGTAEGFLRDLLNLKDNMSPLCVIALGYPCEE